MWAKIIGFMAGKWKWLGIAVGIAAAIGLAKCIADNWVDTKVDQAVKTLEVDANKKSAETEARIRREFRRIDNETQKRKSALSGAPIDRRIELFNRLFGQDPVRGHAPGRAPRGGQGPEGARQAPNKGQAK